MSLKYFIGTKESRAAASKKARDDLKETIKKSIFCSVSGFIIFSLAAFSVINHSITGNKNKKQQAVYAIYHNAIPFLEVTCLMVPIMYIMHSRVGKLSNLSPTIISISSPFICLSAAFTMCMSLRLLGIREDCCGDIDYGIENNSNINSFFDAEGSFKGIAYNIPQCDNKRKNLPPYFTKDFSATDKPMSGFFTKVIFKSIYSLLCLPLFFVQMIDLTLKSTIDLCTQGEISASTKKIAKLHIPCSFYMVLLFVPFCEKSIGQSFNNTVDNYISTKLNESTAEEKTNSSKAI